MHAACMKAGRIKAKNRIVRHTEISNNLSISENL